MPCGSAVFARSRSTEFAKVRLTVTSRRASSSSTAGRFADRLEHAREHVGRRSEGRGVTLEAAVHVADYQGRYRDWSEPVKEAIEEDDEQHPRAAAATGCPTRTGEDEGRIPAHRDSFILTEATMPYPRCAPLSGRAHCASLSRRCRGQRRESRCPPTCRRSSMVASTRPAETASSSRW